MRLPLITVFAVFLSVSVFGQKKESRQDKKAEVYYQKAIDILNNSTHNAISKEMANEVLELADKAIKINPEVSKFHRIKGSAYNHLKEFDTALQHLDKAIQLDSNNHAAWAAKGVALENLLKYEQAEACYMKGLKIDKSIEPLYFNLGCLYVKWNKLNKALEYFGISIEMKPSNVESYINRGEIYIRQKEYKKGVKDFDKAISIDSLSKLSYNNRGFCKIYLKQYESAILDFEKSLSINAGKAYDQNYNTDKYCYNNIANAYLGMGNTEMACKYWRTAIEKGYKYRTEWKEVYDIDDPIELIKQHCN